MKIAEEIFQYLKETDLTAQDKEQLVAIVYQLSNSEIGPQSFISVLHDLDLLSDTPTSFLTLSAKSIFNSSRLYTEVIQAVLEECHWGCCPDEIFLRLGSGIAFAEILKHKSWESFGGVLIKELLNRNMVIDAANIKLSAYIAAHIYSLPVGHAIPSPEEIFSTEELLVADTIVELIKAKPELKDYHHAVRFTTGSLYRASPLLVKALAEGQALQYSNVMPHNLFVEHEDIRYLLENDESSEVKHAEVKHAELEHVKVETKIKKRASPKSTTRRLKVTGEEINARAKAVVERLDSNVGIGGMLQLLAEKELDLASVVDNQSMRNAFLQEYLELVMQTGLVSRIETLEALLEPVFSSVIDSSKEGGPACNAAGKAFQGEMLVGTKYQWILRHEYIVQANLWMRFIKLVESEFLQLFCLRNFPFVLQDEIPYVKLAITDRIKKICRSNRFLNVRHTLPQKLMWLSFTPRKLNWKSSEVNFVRHTFFSEVEIKELISYLDGVLSDTVVLKTFNHHELYSLKLFRLSLAYIEV